MRHTLFSLLISSALASPLLAFAHEAGAPFSAAIVDPLVLHHAHIENEQRLNLFALRGMEGLGGPKRNGYEAELELGWSNKEFNFGMEAFVPLVSLPFSNSGREYGIGDIEVRPIKYALVNEPDLVVSIATALTLPTGNEDRGLGSGNTVVTQYVFVDRAIGNWYIGFNAGADARVSGDSGRGVEYGAVVSYSFIDGRPASFGIAPAVPSQSVVFSSSLEWISGKRLSGSDDGERTASLVPGVTAWWPKSGWQIHAGVVVPKSDSREADRVFLLQFGNHISWETWL